MSLWQFVACTDGFNRANGAEETVEPPTVEEYHAMIERHGYGH